MAEMVSMEETLTRVELHDVPRDSEALYTKLHAAMENAGFYRFIAGNNSAFYELPHATYSMTASLLSAETIDSVADRAYNAAITVWPKVGVISASMPIAFRGLKRL